MGGDVLNHWTRGAVAVMVALLAGCAKAPAAPAGIGPPSEDTVQGTTSARGADPGSSGGAVGRIAGLVVDDEQAPLSEARVAISSLALEVRTDGAGAFEITDVAVGTYEVAAAKAGYESGAVKDVQVVEGETARTTIVMARLASPEPFVQIHPQKGSRDANHNVFVAGTLVKGFGGAVQNLASAGRGDEILDVFAEHRWVNSESVMPAGSQISVGGYNAYNPTSANNLCWADGPKSPLSCLAPREKIAALVAMDDTNCGPEKCSFSAIVRGQQTSSQTVEVGLTVTQTWESWISLFYRAPKPEAYSAAPPA